jgi:hypothetical protein
MDLTQIGELVGIILIVCWVAKQFLATKYIPLLAIVLGGVGAAYFSSGDILGTMFGVLTGLATTLGYREVKTALE